VKIVEAVLPEHESVIRDLFTDYFRWVCTKMVQEYQAVGDAESIVHEMVVHDMKAIDIFLPPKGHLVLAFDADISPAGCACTRKMASGVVELKRMFVRPDYRRKGIGAALVRESIRRAKEEGVSEMRLDSAGFMHDAHRLYRSFGFVDIPPYEGSEVPEEYRKHWAFMSLPL
jgi:GNAT superfamily N-acetyltransferase